MNVKLKNARLGSKEFSLELAGRLILSVDKQGQNLWTLDDKEFYLKNGKIQRRRSKRKIKQTGE
jgi:hypothetical protein